MKTRCLLFLFPLLLIAGKQWAQSPILSSYRTDQQFSQQLSQIVQNVGLEGSFKTVDGDETVSFAVIDLNGKQPVFGGVHAHSYIYPASVYKMYVAMEVLKQVSDKKYGLYDPLILEKSYNLVDKVKEITQDPRPLLRIGDTVTVYYLLDLMITRSDNAAANILIDLATRPEINQTMSDNGWKGSIVTRKFLSREHEEPEYKTAPGTVTSAADAADFMYKVENRKLINPWVSMEMKNLLGGQLDTTKLAAGLPVDVMFYHKTGWWNMFTNDVGIVDDGEICYIIALFTPLKEEQADYKLKKLSRQVYELIRQRHSLGTL